MNHRPVTTRRAADAVGRPSAETSARPTPGTNYFCPICGHEFAPEEIGKKPHCRRCGYLESCCSPDRACW